MTLAPGATLGPYQIIGPVGSGGMGEVYKARDTKLNREVAIKVLPEHLAQDPAALARFEREAQSVAALSHSNILAIHDFGSDAGVSYAVTELLDGETLRARMDAGALPVRKAVECAGQIVRGLAAAHAKGIIHRDLKPENIFLTREGQVKILDFGLAKAASDAALQAETALGAGTEAGVVMGTVGYMSPEQVRGRPVDQRTDIFSFGAVFYEMLARRRAFKGDSNVETMNAILKEDPPEFSESPASIPLSLDRIVRRCLEKQKEERFHSAHDLGLALESVSTSSTLTSASRAIDAPAARRWVWPVLAALGLAAVAAGAYLAGRSSGSGGSVDYTRLTFQRGLVNSALMAPDGSTVVYSANWDGTRRLYSARIGSPESLALPFENADVESISPGGELAIILNRRTLAGFSQVGTLARAPISGGAARPILEDVQSADWMPDGSNLVVARWVDKKYQLEFPIGNVVYTTDGFISDTRVSPDGQFVAFLDHALFGDDRGSVGLVDRTGTVRVLTPEYESTKGLAWRSATEIWYAGAEVSRGRALLSVTLQGVIRTVNRTPGNQNLGDVTPDGRALLVHNSARAGLMGRANGATEDFDYSWFDWSQPGDLSADGNWLLLSEQGAGAGPGYAVYLRNMDGSAAVKLGSGVAFALSPDHKWVLAQRMNPTPPQLELQPTGAGDARMVTNDNIAHLGAQFSADGRQIVFMGFAPGKKSRIYLQDLSGGPARPVTPEGVAGAYGLSPDAATLFVDDRLYPIAGGESRPIAGLNAGDIVVRWTSDSHSLLVRRQRDRSFEISRLDLVTGKQTLVRVISSPPAIARMGGIRGLRLSADAGAYVHAYSVSGSDLYLVTGLRTN